MAVRWVDVAAPWLGAVGGDARGTVLAPAIVARVSLRYDEAKADLVHDAEYEAVIFPLAETVDAGGAVAVDHDDRDLLAEPPANAVYRLDKRRSAPSRSSPTSGATSSTISAAASRSKSRRTRRSSCSAVRTRRLRGSRPAALRSRTVAPTRRSPSSATSTSPERRRCGGRSEAPRIASTSSPRRQREDATPRCCRPPGRSSAGCSAGAGAGRAAGLGTRFGRDGRRASRSQPSVGGAGGCCGEQGRRAAR